MFDFPNSPTLNQEVTSPGGVTWIWDGTVWNIKRNVGIPDAPADGMLYARDTNAWQPAAPKPLNSASGNVRGQTVSRNFGDGQSFTTPAGGRWQYFYFPVNSSTGIVSGGMRFGVAAGGVTLEAGGAGYYYIGGCWRIE